MVRANASTYTLGLLFILLLLSLCHLPGLIEGGISNISHLQYYTAGFSGTLSSLDPL